MLRAIGILFLLSLFIPAEFYLMLGGLRLEVYRIVLAIALLYTLFNLRQVQQGADIVDVLLLAMTIVVFTSFWYNHGIAKALESTGIFALETLGAFYLARLFIDSPQRFYFFNQFFITALALFSVFTVYEAFAQQRILHEWAELVTHQQALDPRLYTETYLRGGLLRATSVFEHPILYGTLLATFFPFAVMMLWRYRQGLDAVKLAALTVSMFLTLSSAPLLAVVFQVFSGILVLFWNGARHFWVALLFAGLSGAMLIETLSNRGFLGILIATLTFNPNTGYFRMLQWQYTSDDISNNWLLGIAHHDWTRPYWMEWMGNSIDSFWLLLILQHGLFALLLLLGACFYSVFHVLNRIHQYPVTYRWMVAAWLVAFLSLLLIGFTVDYFGKLQPLFFFMLGAIGWVNYPANYQEKIP